MNSMGVLEPGRCTGGLLRQPPKVRLSLPNQPTQYPEDPLFNLHELAEVTGLRNKSDRAKLISS